MSEFCDSVRAEVCTNWPELANVHRIGCAELTKQHRNCKILQILFHNIALSSALMAATASVKHFRVKVIK